MELHFLKTAWSDIIILKQDNDIAMIDTGYENQFIDIKKYLDQMGIKKIKFILLTHFHRDHYGSIPNLVKNYDVDRVYFKNYSVLEISNILGISSNNVSVTKSEAIRKFKRIVNEEGRI